VPDKGISPIHAEFKKSGHIFYVSDLSDDNETYLDNIRLNPGRDFEIKNGQVLLCGKREFKIEIV